MRVDLLPQGVLVLAVGEHVEKQDTAQDSRVAVIEGVGGADGAEVPGARKKERVRRMGSRRSSFELTLSATLIHARLLDG